ncbi:MULTISPECIES: ABZJ_00895 family protein [unclassified Acinetobacter]|uniref:ABZJ_00895 family protein n=1 Tax=unclassified Acinetobacter TaxID=196816 RepID=UPI0029343C48|nr:MULTISPECIES: ABZJ_00895 family protein [unclassified Acinetobacter]WOE32976.1 ABZJ_00895 family protein [Acinetobacter sp. SAAs470]WOE38454.1 ABZJ_00895 family protein [Acinetobacter sp. SAAs474]
MVSLTRYFIWFFFLLFIFTCLCGVIAAVLPQGVGSILTIFPFLIAMIWVLFKFLKQQHRAPTQAERLKFSYGFSIIFWLFNLSFLLLGIFLFSSSNPRIWQDFLLYIQDLKFLAVIGIMFLLIAVPLFLLSYWFYGPQAKRMAQKISRSSADETLK